VAVVAVMYLELTQEKVAEAVAVVQEVTQVVMERLIKVLLVEQIHSLQVEMREQLVVEVVLVK
jgi:hypothetical protein